MARLDFQVQMAEAISLIIVRLALVCTLLSCVTESSWRCGQRRVDARRAPLPGINYPQSVLTIIRTRFGRHAHLDSEFRGYVRNVTPLRRLSSTFNFDAATTCSLRWSSDCTHQQSFPRSLRLAGGGGCLSTAGPGAAVSNEARLNAQLLRAASKGDTDRVELLLRQGANVNCSNEVQQSPLIKAAEHGRSRTVEQLLRFGADITAADRRGSTALHYAADRGHAGTIANLAAAAAVIDRRNRFGFTPLQYAAAGGHDEAVATLLALGADVDSPDGANWTALHRSAGSGHVSTVLLLARHGARISSAGTAGVTTRLAGAALQAPAQRICASRAVGESQSALPGAVVPGGAAIGAPLQAAAGAAPVIATECAAEGGASARKDAPAAAAAAPAGEGVGWYSPLHEAVWCGHADVVLALLRLGADPLQPDVWGKTPLDLARPAAAAGDGRIWAILSAELRSRCRRLRRLRAAASTSTEPGAPEVGSPAGEGEDGDDLDDSDSDEEEEDCPEGRLPLSLTVDMFPAPFA